MGIKKGWNDVSSGVRASKEFYFEGGRIGYLVLKAKSANSPVWNLHMKMPDDTWEAVNIAAEQVFSSKIYASIIVPAGDFRVSCSITTAASFSAVKLYWCYLPSTLQDAAIF